MLAGRVGTADTLAGRIWGLLGRAALEPDEGLLLHPCRRVHTFGMRFPIDVLVCDGELRVLDVQTLRPWRRSRRVRGARACVELARGAAGGVAPGDRLELEATELRVLGGGS